MCGAPDEVASNAPSRGGGVDSNAGGAYAKGMKKGVLRCLSLGLCLVAGSACSPRYQLRDPTGERFPTVTGQSLDKKPVKFPDAVAGGPAVLLIAYEQKAQFDVDRWILGLLQGNLQARLYELPTIPGALPGLASGFIDDGMRGGIPKEDWGAVVTMYDDADIIARFTGNDNRRNNTRVVVLGQRRRRFAFSTTAAIRRDW